VPDESSVAAAEQAAASREAGPDDLVLVLLSGGASALACLPGEGLSLAEKQALTAACCARARRSARSIASAATLSRLQGRPARLAAARRGWSPWQSPTWSATAPEDIGSGPTVADPTGVGDARAILARYGIAPRARLVRDSEAGPGDFRIVARRRMRSAAAA
jgi:glycerate 2-kinase